MTDPWSGLDFDPWTPVDAEKALRWVLRAMLDAQRGLAQARDVEVSSKHVFEDAKRRAFFADDCPKPARGGFTVADRDAFIEKATASERQDYEIASATKEAAQDRLRTLRDQSMVVAALSKQVSQSMMMAAHT